MRNICKTYLNYLVPKVWPLWDGFSRSMFILNVVFSLLTLILWILPLIPIVTWALFWAYNQHNQQPGNDTRPNYIKYIDLLFGTICLISIWFSVVPLFMKIIYTCMGSIVMLLNTVTLVWPNWYRQNSK